jgi:hypothetical protein
LKGLAPHTTACACVGKVSPARDSHFFMLPDGTVRLSAISITWRLVTCIQELEKVAGVHDRRRH